MIQIIKCKHCAANLELYYKHSTSNPELLDNVLTRSNYFIPFSRESPDAEGKDGKDTSVDIGVLKFSPQLKDTRELRAKPESGDTTQKFITSLTEAEKYEVCMSPFSGTFLVLFIPSLNGNEAHVFYKKVGSAPKNILVLALKVSQFISCFGCKDFEVVSKTAMDTFLDI